MQEWWRPDGFAARRPRLEQRRRILDAVRNFFAAPGYIEVDTPALQVSPGLEPHLRAFATMLHDPRDRDLVARDDLRDAWLTKALRCHVRSSRLVACRIGTRSTYPGPSPAS